MADENKKTEEKKQDESQPEKKSAKGSKSPILTYVIIAFGALLVTIVVGLALIPEPVEYSEADADAYDDEEYDAFEKEKSYGDVYDMFSELSDLSFLNDTSLSDGGADSERKQTAKDSLTVAQWIEREKKTLIEQKINLDKREKELDLRERSVDQKLTRLQQFEASKYSDLAKLYDGMKPEQVARLLVKLDNKTIVAILPRMKNANAAKILGLMPPERGARISRAMITLSTK